MRKRRGFFLPASSGWHRCTNIGGGKSRDAGDTEMREFNNRTYAYAFSAAFVMFCRIARKRLPVRWKLEHARDDDIRPLRKDQGWSRHQPRPNFLDERILRPSPNSH